MYRFLKKLDIPLIKHFKATNIRNAIILNTLYFTMISIVVLSTKDILNNIIKKKQEDELLKSINKKKIDNKIHNLHNEIQRFHEKKTGKIIIKKNEDAIIKLIKLKSEDISKIINEVKQLKKQNILLKNELIKVTLTSTRLKIINEIIEIENKISNYEIYIDNKVKLPFWYKLEWLLIITLIISLIFAFVLYFLFYIIFGFGGGMLSPCEESYSCKWI